MFGYEQATGKLRLNGELIGMGYSGTDDGRNNPAMENVENVGPIPKGTYSIGKAHQHPQLGPCVMNLDPMPGTDTHGRTAFRMHGDNTRHDASHGCIIMNRTVRDQVNNAKERILEVV